VKTVEEVEAEIDKCLAIHESNIRKIERIKKNGKLKSDTKIREEQLPLKQQNIYLRERVELLAQIKEEKIPFYEKLPKDSTFYKHYMNLLVTRAIDKSAVDKLDEDKTVLKEVNEKI